MYQNKTRKVKIISSKNNNKLKRIKIHQKHLEIINWKIKMELIRKIKKTILNNQAKILLKRIKKIKI